MDCRLIKSSIHLPKIAAMAFRHAHTLAAENGQPLYYFYLPNSLALPIVRAEPVEAQAISRLQCVLDIHGASHGEIAKAHYVVETDPETGWDDEIARWYAEEHLPGLAAVPGCIRAQRFINLDHSPRSFACYDLTSAEVLGSPAWLKVRETAWSDRCRPHFTNTLRTKFSLA